MSRHRQPHARPDRPADIIAPVSAGAGLDGPTAASPRVRDAAAVPVPPPEAAVPAPRRPVDETGPGRHAVRPSPDVTAVNGRHRVVPSPDSAPAHPETGDADRTSEPGSTDPDSAALPVSAPPPTGGRRRRRDEAADSASPARPGGRRRRDETAQPAVASTPSGGRRRRAEDTEPALGTPSGGRRRAEDTEPVIATPSGGRRRRAEDTEPAVPAPSGGRRRRAEDTAVAGDGLAPSDTGPPDRTAVTAADDAVAADRTVPPVARHSTTAPDAVTASRHGHRRTGSRHAGTGPAGRRHATLRSGNRRRGALVLVTVAAGLLALPTVSSASADQCRWQRAAHNLFVALDNRTDDRSDALRDALTQAGVGPQLPAECSQRAAQASATTAPTTASTTTSATRPTSVKPTSAKPTTTAPPTTTAADPTTTAKSKTARPAAAAPAAPAPVAAGASAGTGSTAAAAMGWGAPVKSDDFSGDLGQWGVYNGAGHGGNGRRTPAAANVADGMLTITGDGNGNSAGMAWGGGQKYGRWEARVRSTAGDDSYHPVLLLWPDAENWPVGGEIDWMEISDANRQDADTFLHYSSSNKQVSGTVKVDATQWHNWAVEWSPQGITTYLDGKKWWSTTNTSILPPGPMHMTIQLDYFGGGNPKTSQMVVDWVHQYKM